MAEKKKTREKISEDGRDRFRRPGRKVLVRRRAAWRRVLSFAGKGVLALLVLALLGGGGWLSFDYVRRGDLFRLRSAEGIEILQARHVSPEAVRERFAGDVGRSLFWVPLGKRRRAVEEIPWVESAAVERILPDKLRVFLVERTPVAFLRQGNFLWLIDAEGVLLPVPEGGDYDFPVVTGIPESFSREQRAVRVKLYRNLLEEVDAGGKAHSAQLSEVDVSDLEDVTVVVPGPAGAVRVHFGRGRYGEKFESFLEHRPLWQKSGEVVLSVDLRYRGQIVINPGRNKVARR